MCQSPNKEAGILFDENRILTSPSGAALNVYLGAAKTQARAIVHINHGLAEHAARYGAFCASLNEAGYHAIAHDHRGHGATKAADAPPGVFSLSGDGVGKVMSDVASVQEFAIDRFGDLPVFVFGHSMGGLIAMNFALRHPHGIAGAAVWNANFSAGIMGRLGQLLLRYEQFRLGSDMPSRIVPSLTFAQWAKQIKNRRTDFDWLSHIDAQVDAYIADPLCGWNATVSLWQDVFEMVFYGADLASASSDAKTLPFNLVGGGNDPATFGGKAVSGHAHKMAKNGFGDVTCTIHETARHETLNDRDSAAATTAFIQWLDSIYNRAEA